MPKNFKKRKKIANKATCNVRNNNDDELQLSQLDDTGDAPPSPVHNNQDQDSILEEPNPGESQGNEIVKTFPNVSNTFNTTTGQPKDDTLYSKQSSKPTLQQQSTQQQCYIIESNCPMDTLSALDVVVIEKAVTQHIFPCCHFVGKAEHAHPLTCAVFQYTGYTSARHAQDHSQ